MTDDRIPGEATDQSPPRASARPEPRVVEEVAQQPSRDAPAADAQPRVPEERAPGRASRRAPDAPPNPTPTLDLEGAVGIGVDLVAITAFAEQLDEPGTRFARVFTPGERRTAGDDPQRLAARWAAKEAVIKAWSSTYAGRPDAIDRDHVDLREIEVRTDAWGRPSIRLHGEIARGMAGYTVLVSLTHDPAADTAAAFVVLQKT